MKRGIYIHKARRLRKGFTFAEMLAAMVFVGIVIPVAIQALLTANRIGEVAQRKRVATQIGDELLNELIVTGDWVNSETDGDFGEDWPEYRWELTTEEWGDEAMPLLTIHVFFKVRGHEYSITLSTLAEGTL